MPAAKGNVLLRQLAVSAASHQSNILFSRHSGHTRADQIPQSAPGGGFQQQSNLKVNICITYNFVKTSQKIK